MFTKLISPTLRVRSIISENKNIYICVFTSFVFQTLDGENIYIYIYSIQKLNFYNLPPQLWHEILQTPFTSLKSIYNIYLPNFRDPLPPDSFASFLGLHH